MEDSQEVEGVEPTVPRAALPYLYFEMLLQLYTININCYIYIATTTTTLSSTTSTSTTYL